VEVKDVKEVRYVEMLVMESERAWAGAMESKEAEESQERGGRAKFHSLRRLRKAVQWAKQLATLCEECADPRTQLEAQAYLAWMSGNESFERENWQQVLAPLMQAKTIYEQLAKAVTPEQSEYYTVRVDELTTLYRYALSKSGASSAASSADAESIRSMMTLASDDPALRLLQSKLGSVIEATQRQRAEQNSNITWFGKSINIKSPALRLAFVKAHETMAEVEALSEAPKRPNSDTTGPVSAATPAAPSADLAAKSKKKAESLGHKLAAYDRLFLIWSDTKLKIRDERAASLQMEKNETILKELELMMNYATYTEQNQMIIRNLLLVASIEKKIDAVGFDNLESVKPDEVVRMYESTLQLLSETEQIRAQANATLAASSEVDVAALKAAKATMEGREFGYKAIRCYYLALSYTQVEKWSDAVALIQRAQNYAELAQRLLSGSDSKLSKRLSHLGLQMRSASIWIQAKSALLASPESSSLQTSSDAADLPSVSQTLLSDLKSWDAPYALTKLIDFPPQQAQPITQKPVLFDLAFSGFQAPDLTAKAKAPKSGFFSSFWRS
jgi:signal recognition particle subunit SRP68